MNTGKVLLGLLAGVAIGATMGILFAPDKGTSTRNKIARKSNEYVEEWEETFNEFMSSIARKFESLKSDALDMAENGEHKIKELTNTIDHK